MVRADTLYALNSRYMVWLNSTYRSGHLNVGTKSCMAWHDIHGGVVATSFESLYVDVLMTGDQTTALIDSSVDVLCCKYVMWLAVAEQRTRPDCFP